MATQALLIHDQEQPLANLRLALEKQSVGTVRARSCAEALDILNRDNAPLVVFTDLTVSDGSWADALRLARQTKRPVDLVIVSQLVDVPLYIAAMESGAFDFMVPPFGDDDVAFVVKRATDDVERRSGRKARAAVGTA